MQRTSRLARGGPLRPFSEKRLRELAEQGITHPGSTFAGIKRTAEMPTRKASARPTYTGPDKLTVETVWERDGGRCGWCGYAITGVRALDWSVQHRRPRRRDGERPDTNLPSNLELVHGADNATGCHGKLENPERRRAIHTGHILHADAVPSQEPIEHAVHGRCWLTDDGDWSRTAPPIDRGDRIDFGGYWDDEGGAA